MYLGEGEKDLYGGANVAKVSAMAAGKEIDIMICDLDNAAGLPAVKCLYQ